MKKFGIILVIITILLELTIFNINFYSSLLSKGKQIEFDNDELIEKTTVSDDYQIVELNDLDTEVKNLYIKFDNASYEKAIKYELYYSDETTVSGQLWSKEYVEGAPKTQNTILSLSGKIGFIKIKIFDTSINISNIKINSTYPFEFNLFRVLTIISIGLLIYSIKNHSFWNNELKDWKMAERFAIYLLLNISILIMVWFNYYNYSSIPSVRQDFYSKDFVKALSKGQLYLDLEPSKKLTDLDNPYDYALRVENEVYRNQHYIWDAALYNGHFYAYFGVLPAITIMVPFHLITHKYLPSGYLVAFFTVLTMAGLTLLLIHIYKKYFEKVKFKYFFACLAMLLWGTFLTWINIAPRFYELAAVSGMAFVVWGIYLILSCPKEDAISYKRLTCGCLSMALAVACRPTMLLTSLVIAPFLLKIIFKDFKEKKVIKSLASIVVPYALVGIALMIYNYLRFDNPFEFGINYQLTLNDTAHLAFRPITLLVGFFTDLFNFPIIKPVFPFIFTNANILHTFAYYYVEDMPAGVFFMAPICFAIFGIKSFIKSKQSRDLKQLVVMLLVTGIVMITVCSIRAGTTGRYLLDFAWIFVLAGIIIFLEILNGINEKEEKWASKILAIILVYTLAINLLSGFSTVGSNSMKLYSPLLFYKIQNLLMFWL